MRVLTAEQIRSADAHTIATEPIASIDLMERAALACVGWITQHEDASKPVLIICGTGNNGGDGLVIARHLQEAGWTVDIWITEFSQTYSPDCQSNLERLDGLVEPKILTEDSTCTIPEDTLILDCIFGTGLTRSVEGWVAQLINKLNDCTNRVISIDVPSGLFCDDNRNNSSAIVQANTTLTFQVPKLTYMMSDNYGFVGDWHVLDIGLDQDFISSLHGDNYYVTPEDVRLPVREKFEHKGDRGHALLVAGSYGMLGAAVLSGRACLKIGAALLTMHVPAAGYEIIQTSLPEAMVSPDDDKLNISGIPVGERISAIGIGPGLGKEQITVDALKKFLNQCELPLVLDADALNIIADNPQLLDLLPNNAIITPHVGEFHRLAGVCDTAMDRFERQKEFAQKYQVIVVLKGAHTCTMLPNGQAHFNSTGNPQMATGGSGDVLTGTILGLLAQGLSPKEAAISGVYLHGNAGDRAVTNIIASDIIKELKTEK